MSRSREPQKEAPEEPRTIKDPVTISEPRSSRRDDVLAKNQPAVAKKERSTARSAALIVGAAAAGAAIGAAAGGGKGAAIGAVTGGAGGYVYDRMTHRHGVLDPSSTIDKGNGSHSDADQRTDSDKYDREPSIARRFGTPRFN